MRRNIKSLGYFERRELIDTIARKLAKEQGYIIDCGDLSKSKNYKVRSYLALANIALSEIERFLEQ